MVGSPSNSVGRLYDVCGVITAEVGFSPDDYRAYVNKCRITINIIYIEAVQIFY